MHDIVTFTQIIGFVGFQARAVALLQAQPGQPARWLPGIDMQQDAPAAAFAAPEPRWLPDLPTLEMGWASAEQQAAYNAALDEPLLQPMLSLLVHDAAALQGLPALLNALRAETNEQDVALVAMLSARINGSSSCFDEAARRWRGEPNLPDAMRNGERGAARLEPPSSARARHYSGDADAHPRACAFQPYAVAAARGGRR